LSKSGYNGEDEEAQLSHFWTQIMTNKKLDGVEVWKQFEDLAVPRLELSVFERAAYAHLLRHTRLEGRLRLCFSIPGLARGARLSERGARRAVRSLVAKGALRLAERSKAGTRDRGAPCRRRSARCAPGSPRRAAWRTVQRGQPGEGRFSANGGTARGDPRARGRALLLLPAAVEAEDTVP
jgi:hypothetical protein